MLDQQDEIIKLTAAGAAEIFLSEMEAEALRRSQPNCSGYIGYVLEPGAVLKLHGIRYPAISAHNGSAVLPERVTYAYQLVFTAPPGFLSLRGLKDACGGEYRRLLRHEALALLARDMEAS